MVVTGVGAAVMGTRLLLVVVSLEREDSGGDVSVVDASVVVDVVVVEVEVVEASKSLIRSMNGVDEVDVIHGGRTWRGLGVMGASGK